MPSRGKRAHQLHALAQPAGHPYPHLDAAQTPARSSSDSRLLTLFADLCAAVPDAEQRANLLGVSTATTAAWERGTALPLLRASRRRLEHALRHATPNDRGDRS